MAKPSQWFKNGRLRLSLHRNRSKPTSPSSSSASLPSPATPYRALSREDELREVFSRFDSDGDGKISALELRKYFKSVGECMSHEEAEGVIRDLDTDGDDLIDFEDFLRLMNMEIGQSSNNDHHSNSSNNNNKNNNNDLRGAFEMFQYQKGSGCITPEGLQVMLRRLGDVRSIQECEAMIRVYDIDGNGVLDFHEFHQMMTA